MNVLFDNIETTLLNILFIYFSLTMYYQFLKKKTNRLADTLVIILVCGLSIIFFQTFPIITIKDIPIDFRQIPFIAGALYGGRRVAVILTGILLAYRFFAGPDFITALCVYSLLLLLLCIVIPFYKSTVNLRKKAWISLCISVFFVLLTTALNALFLPLAITGEILLYTFAFSTIQAAGVLFCILFIEKAKKDFILSNEIAKLEKLKTVSTIAASISHEIRNPLTVTKGFLQLLRDSGLSEQDKEHYIVISLEALEKAESIITDYLTFAKPSLENVKMLDLFKELTSIKNFLEPYAALNNVKIEMSLEKNLYAAGEKDKFNQCFINIAKNGIEAMPQGGNLKIKLKRLKEIAVITVEDTGIGMNKEQLERLGSPFFTTKDIGTGLGTMVVYSVVKSMGGEIHIESCPGKGTSFAVSLPAAEGTAANHSFIMRL
ncbi:ATP-binding protein [Domibacillus indicus]|uniref:ATP-binding protein n=1 Tax=Domibacillus indicus TaxID=1437523 RepID=UPI000617EC9A|nr:sensor histidine kinase [Domibacillus indicus]